MSRPNSARASAAYVRTRQRRVEDGDLVMIQANTCAGGYWTDITRTYSVGAPSTRIRKCGQPLKRLRDAGLRSIHRGAAARDREMWKKLRLWCLIGKGYIDIEIDYRASKRDWLEAQDIAKSLGEDQWVTKASGELDLIAFLEVNVVIVAGPSDCDGVFEAADHTCGGRLRKVTLAQRDSLKQERDCDQA
jgi:hypothetical protein